MRVAHRIRHQRDHRRPGRRNRYGTGRGLGDRACNGAGTEDFTTWFFLYDLLLTFPLCGGLIFWYSGNARRPKTVGVRSRSMALCCLCSSLLVGWTVYYLHSPRFYIQVSRDKDAPDTGEAPAWSNKLIALGPRATGPTIEEVGNGGSAVLPSVLKGLGPSAHGRLVVAIDKETDSWKRILLVDALRQAFGDFGRVHL